MPIVPKFHGEEEPIIRFTVTTFKRAVNKIIDERLKTMTDKYFETILYQVLKDNPLILEGMKLKEDKDKIYTSSGYFEKDKLNEKADN